MPQSHLYRLAQRVARESLRRVASPGISPGAQKVLRTLAAGKKGAIDMTAFPEAMEALGGSVTATTSAQRLDPERFAGFLKLTFGLSNKSHGFLSGDWAKVDRRYLVFRLRTPEDEQFAEKIRAAATIGNPPAHPPLNALFCTKWEPVEDAPREAFYRSFGEVFAGVRAWRVALPNGAETLLSAGLDTYGRPPAETDVKSDAFWKFLYANGIKEAAESALQGNPNMRLSPAQMRTMENTGTCSVCLRNIKIKTPRSLADHGYSLLSGWGRSEKCPGADYPPYEVSPEGAIAYRDLLRTLIAEKKAAKDKPAPDPIVIPGPPRLRIPSTSPDYPKAERAYREGLDAALRTMTMDLRDVEERLPKWQPRPLPGKSF